LPIYAENYAISRFLFTTADIDFSIIRPHDSAKKSNPSIHVKLTEVGYIPHRSPITQHEKYIPALESAKNKLSIEFLCEPGSIIKAPYRVKGLDIIITPLRYQRILHENAIGLILDVSKSFSQSVSTNIYHKWHYVPSYMAFPRFLR
jgi:hypothetical protein